MKNISNSINYIDNEIRNVNTFNSFNKKDISNQIKLKPESSVNKILFQETVSANYNGVFYYSWRFYLGNVSINMIHNIEAKILVSGEVSTEWEMHKSFSMDNITDTTPSTWLNIFFTSKQVDTENAPVLTLVVFQQSNTFSLFNQNPLPMSIYGVGGG